jgi:hypothetical protein
MAPVAEGGEVSKMTTTLEQQSTVLDQTDIHAALDIPPVTPPTETTRPRRQWGKWVALGASAGLLGLAVGYGAAAWNYTDEINQLESQAQVMTQVPYGGFAGEYGAAREHLVLADIAAARLPTGFDTTYSARREHLVRAQNMEEAP